MTAISQKKVFLNGVVTDRREIEGILDVNSQTVYPGTIMTMKLATAAVQGKFTYQPYNRDADGNNAMMFVLLEDYLQGKTIADAYTDGARIRMVVPLPGDEFLLRFGNASGTADDVAIGAMLIADDGTGEVIPTTGSPEYECAIALETLTDPTADTALHCMWAH